MWNSDTISALLVLGITVFGYLEAKNFSYYGGVFVSWVLLILFILGVVLLAKGLFQHKPFKFWKEGAHSWQVAGVVVILAGYILLIPWAGFLVSSAVVLSLLCLLLSPPARRRSWRGWLVSLSVGVSITLLFYVIFKYGLLVPLPPGVLFS
ncbi:MAG: tripartite tricarboxylate transporter TctB family protein [Firmicutes bacterium]|nr:tripartite tricarboxylate transporter TctB family protein [Bacillota bacterium]